MATLRQESDRRRRGYVFGLVAALTCPCHLLLAAPLLAGTAAGAFLTEHFATALILLTVLFMLSLTAASRMLRDKSTRAENAEPGGDL
jgi:mercuric ion transport protein